jgi:hypothetical protein
MAYLENQTPAQSRTETQPGVIEPVSVDRQVESDSGNAWFANHNITRKVNMKNRKRRGRLGLRPPAA